VTKRSKKHKQKAGLSPALEHTTGGNREPLESRKSQIATGVKPQTEDEAYRAFWPEFAPGMEKIAESTGRGGAYQRMSDMALAIRAVSDSFPVPRAAVERLVFDVIRQSTDPSLTLEQRQRSQKLLSRMIERNAAPKGLPDQLQTLPGQVLSIQQVLDVIDVDDNDIDLRDFKPAIGSDEDYAE
jgi:hypothetical protein